MKGGKGLTIAMAVGLLLAGAVDVSSAAATHKHHHRTAGTSVRNATDKADANAGTAKEVAPDSKQSATGGQPGGLPGHQ